MNEEQRELVVAKMREIARMSEGESSLQMARLFGDVYDKELPINSVIEAVANTVRAEVGEDVDYLVPEDVDESVFTISANCNVVQTKVSPSSDQELAFTDLVSDERYTCIHDWLKGKHNVIKLHTDAIIENMNRQEEYSVIQLLDAGAVASSNVFTLDSGKTAFDYPKLVAMRKSVRKYGRKLVLISGSNVTENLDLLDYDSDKQRDHAIDRVVDEWITIEDYSVTINTVATPVIDPDKAYLIAVSDSKGNKPVLFARRKTTDLTDMADTKAEDKERIMIVSGNLMNVGTNRKLSRAITGFGEYGAVLLNEAVVASFTL
jgi:hypothetical protein